MDVSDGKRLKALETENTRIEKLLAEALLEQEATREVLWKKVVSATARRKVVHELRGARADWTRPADRWYERE